MDDCLCARPSFIPRLTWSARNACLAIALGGRFGEVKAENVAGWARRAQEVCSPIRSPLGLFWSGRGCEVLWVRLVHAVVDCCRLRSGS